MQKKLGSLIGPGKRVFFIGIGGVGMSALAKVLNARGLRVSGSDSKKSRQTASLEQMGIAVSFAHGLNFDESYDW